MLDDKVAWITGGGSGIGLAVAIEMAKAGAKVVISGRSGATLKEALKQVQADTVVCDVGDKAQVAKAAAEIQKRHARVDILVNSAGINLPKRNFRDVTNEGWDEIIRINLSGMFYCIQAVLPGMRKSKDGVIINVSSWFGRYANALGGPGYVATKRAVVALTEQLNIEECTNGIRATAVLPGEAATPILEKRPVPPSPEVRAKMLQPEDLGRTLAFIASLPPRVCINEIIVSPTWNRFLIGGLEAPK
ncbi:MAG TPA: SDR family oxidoreductase [Burkholderiales bacterium]|jgi:NAD(P)-dependent dehydrogenase (short-subunit alcohol dehydrogenase family)